MAGTIELAGKTLGSSDCGLIDGILNVGRIVVEIMRKPRQLRASEISLIHALLETSPAHLELSEGLNALLVVDQDDGGMGSLTIVRDPPQVFARQIAEINFLDRDGVAVSATLNVDANGDLFELDVFKGDFSPLRSEFSPHDLDPIDGSG